MQYPEPSPAAGICRTVSGGMNMPYSLMQNEPIAPAAGSSPYSP